MADSRPTLAAIFARFLRFGLFAWGGPVAQVAMIKRELVEEEKWLTPERFNRLLAVYQVLPGPEAHELCVHLGMMQRGRLGGILAGLGFMLPGFLLILGIAWFYERIDLGQPLISSVFLGIQIGVIALIVRAVHRIGEHVLVDKWLWSIGVASAVGSWLGVSFWIILPAAGLFYASAAAGRTAPLLRLRRLAWRWRSGRPNPTACIETAAIGLVRPHRSAPSLCSCRA
jgi:chromate transporter